MMNVCFLPAWFYDIQGHGGGNFFLEQAAALQSSPHLTMNIFYPALAPQYAFKPQFNKVFQHGLSIVKYQRWSVPKRFAITRAYYAYTVEQAFKQYLQLNNHQMPDLIHSHSFWGAFAAMVIKWRWNIPFVYTEHLSSWSISGKPIHHRYHKLLTRVIEEAALSTAVSASLAQNMMKYSHSKRVVNIPNMVDTAFFSPTEVSKFPNAPFRLISIGDPWHAKGLDTLIEAVGKAQKSTERQIVLTLVDDIPERAVLYTLIKAHKLEEQVIFTGKISRSTVSDLLPQQDVLVSASRQESFGITMIEAFASGIPVIATQTAGALDIVTPTTGLLVPIEDSQQLAMAITSLANKEKTFVPQHLVTYAQEQFGRQVFIDRWLEHYEQILNKAL